MVPIRSCHPFLSFFRAIPFWLGILLLLASCEIPGFGQKSPCGGPQLKIGKAIYQIRETETRSDGSLNIPPNKSGIAYWVNRTETNHVFALSPTPENLALQDANPEQAILTWENCNSSTYVLSMPEAGVPAIGAVLDQSFSGITIFIQGDGGFVIHGELIGEEIQAFDTPDPSAIQAEITLPETVPSADKTTIQVKISITNYGQTGFVLAANDVSLAASGSTVTLLGSEPALPREIAVGATESFLLTFAYPASPGAILRVLGVEYELEGY